MKQEKPLSEKDFICGKLRNESHRNLYYNGYLLGKEVRKQTLQNIKRRTEKNTYELGSLVYGFLESIESFKELFCDCNVGDKKCHKEDCMSVKLQKDIDNLSEKISEKRKEQNKIFSEEAGDDLK